VNHVESARTEGLLAYRRNEAYWFDAAVALSLLSLVASVAAARYLGSGGPFE